MQIVIEISDKIYKKVKEHYVNPYEVDEIGQAILDGTILPKGHGDLIDRDKLQKSDLAPESWYSPMWAYSEYEVEDAPTIIEGSESE